jgi:cytosine deaminase
VAVEEAFNNLKGDLAIRQTSPPQGPHRGARLHRLLGLSLSPHAGAVVACIGDGAMPRSVFGKFAAAQMTGLHLPTTDGRELVLTSRVPPPCHLLWVVLSVTPFARAYKTLLRSGGSDGRYRYEVGMNKPWIEISYPADFRLRNARVPSAFLPSTPGPADSEGLVRLDLRIADGRIAALAPLGSATDGIDLDGGQVWPGLVDAHVHLDKTQIWPRAANRDGTHGGARTAAAADRPGWSEADIDTRFAFGLGCAYAHGTVAMRTHIDSYWPYAPIGWRVFRNLREAWAGRITLQASSICPLDHFIGEVGIAMADEVANSGGVLGMVTTDLGDPDRPIPLDVQDQLDRFFVLAEERGLALDLHIDETGDTRARMLHSVASTALRRNFHRPIQCGHCCSLALQPDEFAAETIRLCAEAGIAIVALPMCNMYLQGRNSGRTPRWRGITLVHEFHATGVPVSFASDNCRDPFYAYGDYDLLEVYREAVRIAHLDHPFGDWVRSVGPIPAAALGVPQHGHVRVGADADLILFRARSMTELLARPQSDRVILRNGRAIDASPPDYRELDQLLAQ